MNDELITRLRAAADKSERGEGEWFQLIHRCREAADALEAAQAELERHRALNDPELTFRDIEMKMRDGTIDVQTILGDGSRPVMRFLAGLLLHFVLGEGDQPPVEPPNYLAGSFSLKPADGFEDITVAFEVIKPGGKSSHEIRAAVEAERDAAQAEAKVWMNAVADAVEPMGFDREAACGPADLIPGLRWLVENEAKARAERDAEAALADRLAEALQDEMDEAHADHGWRMGPNTRGALAAHRERRTTPTKDGDE